jgi:hypothetical protein
MTSPTIKRSGKTNQFIVEQRDGIDTIRCAVHIDGAAERPEEQLRIIAMEKAQSLAARLASRRIVDEFS